MPRLRRSSTAQPGWSRRRAGRGFVYLDAQGRRLPPQDTERVKALVIPPAWQQVWICPWPNGHLQAVGTDDAGRRQYLYHEAWRLRQDRRKFDRALDLAECLPTARERVARDLARRGMPAERALAAGFRLLDLGALRIGGERYAARNDSVGLVTLERRHVRIDGKRVRIGFLGKAGREQQIEVRDRALRTALAALLDREEPGERLLAWQAGSEWRPVTSAEMNAYIRDVTGQQVSAKDLRTLRATAVAAAWLAGLDPAGLRPAERRRAAVDAVRAVSEYLGNTPAVARASYVDPRVTDAFLDGRPVLAAPGGRAAAGGLRGGPDALRRRGIEAFEDVEGSLVRGLRGFARAPARDAGSLRA